MERVRYSVIIPALNAEAVLPKCLEALDVQTVSPEEYEVIVVDDGSEDGTFAVAERLGARAIRQTHKGPAAARNLGAATARGRVLLFTDADCRPEPGWIKALACALESGADGAQGVYRTRQRDVLARFAQSEFEERYVLMRSHDSIDLVATYAAAFRREAFEAVGGFDESYTTASNEDTDLSYRLGAGGKLLVLAGDAVVFHEHPATLGRYMQVKFGRAMWRMKVYRRFPEKAVHDRYTTWPVKAQTALAVCWFVLLGVGMFWPLARQLSWLCPVLVLSSSLAGARRLVRIDPSLGMFYPFGVLCRSLALGAGVIAGLLRP